MGDQPDIAIIIVLGVLFTLTVAAILGFWGWMLFDCVTKETSGSSQQVVWALIIVCFGILGAFAYNVGRRKQRMKELGR